MVEIEEQYQLCQVHEFVFDPHHGYQVCEVCGFVPNPSRLVGEDSSETLRGQKYHEVGAIWSGLGASIDWSLRDVHGHLCSDRPLYRKMRTYEKNIMHDTKHYRQSVILGSICQRLAIPMQVRSRTVYLFKNLYQQVVKRSRVVLLAVCLYFAIREVHYPLPVKRIITAFQENGNRISQRAFNGALLDVKPRGVKTHERVGIYIPSLVSDILQDAEVKGRLVEWNLNSNDLEQHFVKKIPLLLAQLPPSGANPRVLVVAAIYALSWNPRFTNGRRRLITQSSLARITGLGEYSIRDVWRHARLIWGNLND